MTSARRALVVDDAPDLRYLLGVVLRAGGFDVTEADGGIAALKVLETLVPDIVVLDVQMPDIDGWETLRRLRERYRVDEVAVVMCTIKDSDTDRERAWLLGCDGYVVKPFALSELASEVEAVLDRSSSERDVLRQSRLDGIAADHRT